MSVALRPVKLGLVPISKFVFSQEDARRYKGLVQARLRALEVDFVDLEGVTDDGMLFRHSDLAPVVRHLRAAGVDALFCPHCNFGTEDVASLLGREMGLPYLLWGPRDEAPLPDGTRLRDTQCGLFATSRILQHLGVPFTYIPNCRLDDPVLDRGIQAFMQVAATVKAFRHCRIGQIGQRNDFFWTVMVNEAELLQKFGLQVWQIYIEDLVTRMRDLLGAPTGELEDTLERMRQRVRFESLNEGQIAAVAALKVVLTQMAEELGLAAISLQCFPTLQRNFGIYPCYANSLITEAGVPVICESDIHGSITAVLLQAAAGETGRPFFADLTNRHPDNNNAELLWHCGAFPLNLADEGVEPVVGAHFIMPGPEAGVGHWRIRGGPLTIARFDAEHGDYRLGFGHGEGTTGPETVGAYLWMQVQDWLTWERKFIRGPYIHHVAGIHGHLGAVLQEACRYIPGLTPDPIEPDAEALEQYWWR